MAIWDQICNPSIILSNDDTRDPLWLGLVFPCHAHSSLTRPNPKNGGNYCKNCYGQKGNKILWKYNVDTVVALNSKDIQGHWDLTIVSKGIFKDILNLILHTHNSTILSLSTFFFFFLTYPWFPYIFFCLTVYS